MRFLVNAPAWLVGVSAFSLGVGTGLVIQFLPLSFDRTVSLTDLLTLIATVLIAIIIAVYVEKVRGDDREEKALLFSHVTQVKSALDNLLQAVLDPTLDAKVIIYRLEAIDEAIYVLQRMVTYCSYDAPGRKLEEVAQSWLNARPYLDVLDLGSGEIGRIHGRTMVRSIQENLSELAIDINRH